MTRPPGAHLRAPPPGPTPGRLGVRTMLQFPIIVFFMRGILFFDRFYRNRLYLKKNQKRKLYFPFIISASAAPIMVLLKLQLLRFWFDLDEKFWWTHPSIHPDSNITCTRSGTNQSDGKTAQWFLAPCKNVSHMSSDAVLRLPWRTAEHLKGTAQISLAHFITHLQTA